MCSSDVVVCGERVKVMVCVMKLGSGFLFISWFQGGLSLALLVNVLHGLFVVSACPRGLLCEAIK